MFEDLTVFLHSSVLGWPVQLKEVKDDIWDNCYLLLAGRLGLVGRELGHWTNEPGSNPIWDATVHPECKTFNVMRVI